jgi:hypothetical protein
MNGMTLTKQNRICFLKCGIIFGPFCSFALMQKNQKIKAAEKMAKIYSFSYSEKSLTVTCITYPGQLLN